MVRNGIPRIYFSFLLHAKELQNVFSSADWFGTEFREFLYILIPRNGIPSCVLFRRWVRNRIMEVCFYFFPRNGIPCCFLFREGFGTEFRDFLFRGTTGIPSEITISSVYSVVRGIIFFCRKFPTLRVMCIHFQVQCGERMCYIQQSCHMSRRELQQYRPQFTCREKYTTSGLASYHADSEKIIQK
jgi:hypothetical protein